MAKNKNNRIKQPQNKHKTEQEYAKLEQENIELRRQLELQRIKEDVVMRGFPVVWEHLYRVMVERDNYREYASKASNFCKYHLTTEIDINEYMDYMVGADHKDQFVYMSSSLAFRSREGDIKIYQHRFPHPGELEEVAKKVSLLVYQSSSPMPNPEDIPRVNQELYGVSDAHLNTIINRLTMIRAMYPDEFGKVRGELFDQYVLPTLNFSGMDPNDRASEKERIRQIYNKWIKRVFENFDERMQRYDFSTVSFPRKENNFQLPEE